MPYVLDDNGLTIPTQPELLGDALEEYQDPELGFGPEADITEDSPFYKLVVPVSKQQALAWQGLRELSGQFDPESATGQQLDRLGSLIGLYRRAATRSTIPGRVIGTPGTPVPAGVVQYDPLGTRWQYPAGTIAANGVLLVEASAVDFGPVDARIAGEGDWSFISGQVNGVAAFDSRGDATLGALAETNAEFRLAFRNAAVGLATYNAIVNAIRKVSNVTAVYLYVNPKLIPDPVTGLLGKQMRLVVRGGARLDIAQAMHNSMGAPVDTVGAVLSTINPGNGQVLEYRFDRLRRRRGYLRLTYTGGNPLAPVPEDASALVLAAVAAEAAKVQGGQAFAPAVFGLAGFLALNGAVPGCITKMVAEGRLDPGDPWVEDAIVLPLDEVIDIATGPTAAEALSTIEDPMIATGGSTLTMAVNGAPPVIANIGPVPVAGSAAIATVLQPQFAGAIIDSDSGRVRFRTELKGSTASLGFPVDGSLNSFLGLALVLFTGSDGDVIINITP